MKPKHQRMIFIGVSVLFLCVAALLTLRAFRENIVFFYSPSELTGQRDTNSALVRVGGLVEAGSIEHTLPGHIRFRITDGNATVAVTYKGMLPTLFREGQGTVAEGHMNGGELAATRVLTKHDENYMPREVVDALKKSGRWKEGER